MSAKYFMLGHFQLTAALIIEKRERKGVQRKSQEKIV